MSVEEVYQELLDDDAGAIALATVYRALTQFEAAGLVIHHDFEGGQTVFELDDGVFKYGKVVEFHDETIELR